MALANFYTVALFISFVLRAEAASVSCNSTSICFASGLGTGAVLQRAPAQAALYGSAVLAGAQPGTIALTLASVDGTYSKTFPSQTGSDGTWKVLLDAMPTGGNFSATVVCSAGCNGTTSVTIVDLTFGDVWVCFGQSNMWLPLQYTFTRNETLTAVTGGSYSNLRLWRGGLGTTPNTGNWVGPQAPLPPQGSDTINQWRTPQQALGADPNQPGNPYLFQYPSTCFYAFQYLTDMLGADAPPFGLVSVPVGGTTIEQWTEYGTQLTACTNVTCMCTTSGCDNYQPLNSANCTGNGQLYNGNIQPYLNMTVSGWLYYQGENNLAFDAGNSAQKTGYGCLLPAMLAQMRAAWSVVPGTTSPSAPFGMVTLAEGTDEGWTTNMGRMRWAQTANYGVLPNAAMPNSFLVTGHDGGDPWDAGNCATLDCCVDDYMPLGPQCEGDHRGQWSKNGTQCSWGASIHATRRQWGRAWPRACSQPCTTAAGSAAALCSPAARSRAARSRSCSTQRCLRTRRWTWRAAAPSCWRTRRCTSSSTRRCHRTRATTTTGTTAHTPAPTPTATSSASADGWPSCRPAATSRMRYWWTCPTCPPRM